MKRPKTAAERRKLSKKMAALAARRWENISPDKRAEIASDLGRARARKLSGRRRREIASMGGIAKRKIGKIGGALLLALIALEATCRGGSIFSVAGDLSRDSATLSGTLEVDTVDGSLDAVDLLVAPVAYGYFPAEVVRVELASLVLLEHHTSSTELAFRVDSGWAYGALWIDLPVSTLVGYAGGSITPTTEIALFKSGLTLTSPYDGYETRYWPLRSGEISPLVVPEPTTIILAVGVAVVVAVCLLARRVSDD